MQNQIAYLMGLISGSALLFIATTTSIAFLPPSLIFKLDTEPAQQTWSDTTPYPEYSQSNGTSNGPNDVELMSLLYRTDVETERRQSLYGGPMDYLKNYRNPCWISKLTDPNPYVGNSYDRLVESYPGFRKFSSANSFERMSAIFKDRLEANNGENARRMRCLPYVYLAGVTKCGTTDLFVKMLEHPNLVEGAVKEPMWWNRYTIGRFRNLRAIPYSFSSYLDLYDEAGEKIQHHSKNTSGYQNYHDKITIDASPAYLWDNDGWHMIPGNMGLAEPKYTIAHSIHTLVPQARIILIFRNPIDRLYSQFRMWWPKAAPVNFHREAGRTITLMENCLSHRTLRSCVYDTSVFPKEFITHKGGVFLRASMYYSFVADWLSVFPRDQVLALRAEDYYANRTRGMNDVFRFLDLHPLSHKALDDLDNTTIANTRQQHAKRSVEPMLNETREMLGAFFKPFNEKLSSLLNDNRFLWND